MIGQTILHYRILEKLGEGGMGVVYKAQDTNLDRPVALKFLPPQMNASPQDKARFAQEARAASSLNHPNVCTIHDIQESDGQMFIVMEYVEGQTLREKDGAINFKQAVDIGIQLADGLAAAHQKGIVHRDIKPENIMVRKDGIVQIMDFGLAKLSGVSRLTAAGSTMGTASYMSPEQVQGMDSDHRSDIFSLGIVLYELLTGSLPFRGVHETALMYEIVNVDPAPMAALKPGIEPQLDGIVLECLAKEPSERYQSVAEVGKDLRRFKRESTRRRASRITAVRPVAQSSLASPAGAETRGNGPRLLPWAVAAVLFLAFGTLAFIHFREASPEPALISSSILTPSRWMYVDDENEGGIALSSDGTALALVASDSTGKKSLWVRSLNSGIPRLLPETDGASYPFWSPDSRYIGFFSSGKMKKVAVAGGPPFTICDAPNGRGGTWNQEGVILFAPLFNATGISKVSASGGEVSPLTKFDSSRGEQNHRWPSFLPDGRHFLYTAQLRGRNGDSYGAVYVSSIDLSMNKLLMKVGTNAAYAGGTLVFVRQGTLTAQPYDLSKNEFAGDPVPVAEKVEFGFNKLRGLFTVSQNGILIYHSTNTAGGRTLYWYDRSGKRLASVCDRPVYFSARISPDGRKIVFDSSDPESKPGLWVFDIARGISTRLTFDQSANEQPIWSSDGGRVVFISDRSLGTDLYIKNSSGTENETPLIQSTETKLPDDWSADGKYLIYNQSAKSSWDLWYMAVDGDRKSVPFLQSTFDVENARFSPDGRWVAYQSNESGRDEIYVRPFPSGGGKWQVSTSGGDIPLWRKDGREIFYLAPDRTIMSAEVSTKGREFAVGGVKPLFGMPALEAPMLFDAAGTGERFLVGALEGGQSSQHFTLVTNWDRDLRKK